MTENNLLPANEVTKRYGVSTMTLHRWGKDESLGFPEPIRINKRRYWRAGDLVAWERVRAADRSKPTGPRSRTAEVAT